MPVILIRTEAGPRIGLGHLMRCLALAEALRDAGASCHFALSDLNGLGGRLARAGFPVDEIADGPDAVVTLVRTLNAAGIVVDGYDFSAGWQLTLRSAGVPVLAFADGPPTELHADLLLDPSAAANGRADCLFGPGYTLLRPEIRQAALQTLLPMASWDRVLVSFGGSDPAGMTESVTKALRTALDLAVPLDVILGPAFADVERLEPALSRLGNVTVHKDPPALGTVMRHAGLAVSAAGGTSRELAALGVPAILVPVAENQHAALALAMSEGWAEIGDLPDQIAERVVSLWQDVAEREHRVERARAAVGPDGAARAAEALLQKIADARVR